MVTLHVANGLDNGCQVLSRSVGEYRGGALGGGAGGSSVVFREVSWWVAGDFVFREGETGMGGVFPVVVVYCR